MADSSIYPTETLSDEEAWEIGQSLQSSHATKHAQIREVRDLVRQRTVPQQVLKDKYLITARGAVGWAIVRQMLSYFEPTLQKVKVPPRKKNRTEDVRTSNLEGWLIASSETVNRRNDFVEGAAIYNGIETGEMILGAAFDPFLAKRGEFPLEVVAPDPECCAYSRSHYGLTYFVSQELRTVDALRSELATLKKRGKKIYLTDALMDADATDVMEDTRFFTPTREFRWLDGEHLYTRKHFCGRVPFDIGLFNGMPSDRPEEWGRGAVSPVLDLLKSHQQLVDLFVTDAEIGQRPLGILFDGQGHFEIVQIAPGENYDGTALTPVPYNPNQQLLHEIAGMINEQMDIAALPRSTFSGPQLNLSGYALDRFREGLMARLTYLKKNPENALASHMDLRLRIVKRFATNEMAKVFSRDDTEMYLDSFSALGDKAGKKGERNEKVWWAIRAEDVGEQDAVLVELSPNLPADEAGKVQRVQALLASGFPFEWTVREVYQVDNADELLRQREFEMLLASNEMFKQFYFDYLLNKVGERDKEIGKALTEWMKQQSLLEQEAQPQPDMVEGMMPTEMQGAPMESPQGMLPQGNISPAPEGEQMTPEMLQMLLAGAGQGAPMESPQGMLPQGNMPPNAALAQVLMGGQ